MGFGRVCEVAFLVRPSGGHRARPHLPLWSWRHQLHFPPGMALFIKGTTPNPPKKTALAFLAALRGPAHQFSVLPRVRGPLMSNNLHTTDCKCSSFDPTPRDRRVPLFLGYVPRRWCLFWDTKNFCGDTKNVLDISEVSTQSSLLVFESLGLAGCNFFWGTFREGGAFFGMQKTFFGVQKTFLGKRKTFSGYTKLFFGIQKNFSGNKNLFSGNKSFWLTKIPAHHTNYKKNNFFSKKEKNKKKKKIKKKQKIF